MVDAPAGEGAPAAVSGAGEDRLADFVALNDPATRRRVERDGDYFVVEGALAIERLLELPGWRVRTIAVLPRVAERFGDRLAARVTADGGRLVVTGEEPLRAVVGFDLHRGALASVQRRTPVPATDLLAPGALLVATEGVNDHENLGALYRNAAAFGAAGVLTDPTSADPFYRRSIRVSLGHVLAVPTGQLGTLPAGLDDLHDRGATTIALTPAGDRALRELDPAALGPGPVVILVGAEGPGLTDAALAAARHQVRIEMAPGVDSVNVATAAAIALHHLAR